MIQQHPPSPIRTSAPHSLTVGFSNIVGRRPTPPTGNVCSFCRNLKSYPCHQHLVPLLLVVPDLMGNRRFLPSNGPSSTTATTPLHDDTDESKWELGSENQRHGEP